MDVNIIPNTGNQSTTLYGKFGKTDQALPRFKIPDDESRKSQTQGESTPANIYNTYELT